jgi:hypothetical protein
MATNVTLSTSPTQLWNSAYSDIIFVFDFKEKTISSVSEEVISSVGTGFAKITITNTWDVTPVKNEYVYISTGEYAGIQRVISGTSNSVVIDYEFNANITGDVFIKHLRLPSFSLYKGFESGEQFPDALPYTLVTNFTYTFNSNIQLEINVKGIAQKIFQIQPPIITQDYDFSVFNAIRLTWDEETTNFYLVLNSSIPTNELNANYVSGGLPLTNVTEQLLWGCGNTFFTIFEGGYPKLYIYNGFIETTAGFNNAFQTNQFSQGFDIN